MERRLCTFCKKKRSVASLSKVYYRLLGKEAWHCKEHLSNYADILQIIEPNRKKVFLELFSGSGEISQAAGVYGYNTWSVDINPAFAPSICSNILTLNLKQLPKDIDFIWASIPCTTYSVMSLAHHWNRINHSFRKYYYYPKTPEAKQAVQILEKTLHIIRSVAPRVFVIENPRGALRHMPQMQGIPFRHTVSYADYGFGYYKPTDLFTNYPGLKLHKCTSAIGRKFQSSVLSLSSASERSRVPGLLINALLSQITNFSNQPQYAYATGSKSG